MEWNADGRWRPASVIIAINETWFIRQLSAVSHCGEQHSRSTQRSSSVISPTAHTVQTPSSASLQDSQHCRSLFNVWREKCRENTPPVWTQRRSRDFSSNGSIKGENRSTRPENWIGGGAASYGNARYHCSCGRLKPGHPLDDFQFSFYRLLMSTRIRSCHKGFLDGRYACGGLVISEWIGQSSLWAYLWQTSESKWTDNHGRGVKCQVPEMRRMVEFNCTSSNPVWGDCDQTGTQYSATE